MKWGNAGLGSINQLTGSLMLEKLGLKGNSVPYDGGRSAAIKVVAGEVTWSWCGLSDILDLAQSGDIRILGICDSSPGRSTVQRGIIPYPAFWTTTPS
ncbi:tripartite tricarboxylate transporter substrate-binding protein [Faecalibacterium taiwanense]|uniref:tripartite tricarboxylate transporter substrate-binding protein n=1 Tax=Faecalibacterium taiwanense TaxID=3030638 RepID=UPI0031FE87F8